MQTAILTFIIPVIALIFTAVFFALWWGDRKQTPVLAFAVCFGLMALAVVINIWIFEGLDPLGVVAYHLLSMGGMLALMWGVAKRAQVKAPMVAGALSVLIVSPILWYAVSVEAPAAMKMAQNTSSALIISLTAVTVWYGTKRNWADHALVWVLALLAGFGFIRPMLTVFADVLLGPVETGATILTAIHVLVLATLLTLMALCLIASIVHERMLQDREEAAIDILSGLPNRGAYEQGAEALFERARQENCAVSVVVGDLDHFKQVNDTWGHAAGDAIIKSFGQLVSAKVRAQDVAGRIGGEEFCIAVWNCDAGQAFALAERIRRATTHLRTRQGEEDIPVTASFGVAEWKPGMRYADVFAQADKALYSAKDSGRNRVRVWGENEARNHDRKAVDQPVRNVVSMVR